MRKLLSCLLLCSLTASPACKSSSSAFDPMAGLDRVRDSHTLRAAYINYPPSMSVNPGTKALGGIMPRVIEQAASAMGVRVTYTEETSFGNMIDTLDNNRADLVVSGIWPSSARALRADFSRVVYYSPVYAYVRNGDQRFNANLSAINNPKVHIATIDGELSAIVAQSDYPSAATVSLPQQTDVAQLLLQLSSSKADVTFVEPAIADAFLSKNPGSIQRVTGTAPVRLFPNTFLFRKGDTALRDAVNIAILELTNSRKLSAIIAPFDPDGTHFILPTPPVSP